MDRSATTCLDLGVAKFGYFVLLVILSMGQAYPGRNISFVGTLVPCPETGNNLAEKCCKDDKNADGFAARTDGHWHGFHGSEMRDGRGSQP